MKQKTKQPKKSIFLLTGTVGWWVERPADPDYFVGKDLRGKIEAQSVTQAIGIAKQKVRDFLASNPDLAPVSDEHKAAARESRWPRTFGFRLIQTVWEVKYIPEQPGRPATPAIPRVDAYIEETQSP